MVSMNKKTKAPRNQPLELFALNPKLMEKSRQEHSRALPENTANSGFWTVRDSI